MKDEKGSMTVESAIIVPLFILFLLMCILCLIYYFSFVDKQCVILSNMNSNDRNPAEVKRVTDFVIEILEVINEKK